MQTVQDTQGAAAAALAHLKSQYQPNKVDNAGPSCSVPLISLLGAGCSLDSTGWGTGMATSYMLPHAGSGMSMMQQGCSGPSVSQLHKEQPREQKTTVDTSTCYQSSAHSSQQKSSSPANGWPMQVQQRAPDNPDDLVRSMLQSEPASVPSSILGEVSQGTSQRQYMQQPSSFRTGQNGHGSGSQPASSTGMANLAAAAAAIAVMQQQQQQQQQGSQLQQTSNSSGSMGPAGLSVGAFVQQAQHMLMQQQQVMQQQAVLSMLGLNGGSFKQQQQQIPQQQQQHLSEQAYNAACSGLGAGPATISSQQWQECTGIPNGGGAPAPVQQLAKRQQQNEHKQPAYSQQQQESTPRAMRAALGDRTFYSIRSLLVKQQQVFVEQLYELHRLVRVQQMAMTDVMDEHHVLTQQYGEEALAQLQCSQLLGPLSSSAAGSGGLADCTADRLPAAAAATANAAGMGPLSACGKQQQQAQQAAAAQAVTHDDRGEAAVAALPVQMVLLANMPRTMRSAVSQPVCEYSALNPTKYYACQAPGVQRPTPMRYVDRSSGKGPGTAAAAAGLATSNAAMSGEGTVQADERPLSRQETAVCVLQQQYRKGHHCNNSTASLQPNRRPPPGMQVPKAQAAAATAAAQGATLPSPNGPPVTGLPLAGAGNRADWQQQQQMPPPKSMLPEVAAQHVAAAAAAQHQQQLQQHKAAVDAAGLLGGAGLNVFRPMPQIDPLFASKFLAGPGQGSVNPGPTPLGFDPHSYWMKKHYGSSSSNAQSADSQRGADGQGNAAAVGIAAPSAGNVDVGDVQRANNAQNTAFHEMKTMQMLQQRQEQQQVVNTSGFDGAMVDRAAAAAAPVELDPAVAAAAPRPVLHWWQDAEATFGEVGLIDPNAKPRRDPMEASSSRGSAGMRREAPHYLQLPHKKRAKHSNSGYSYDSYGYERQEAGTGGVGAAGAFKPLARPSVTKERSRVRSNRMGSSHQESGCSDNSASSIDNPSYQAAAAAAMAAANGDALGMDADGVSLLLHMGQHARGSGKRSGNGRGGGRSSGGRSSWSAGGTCESGQVSAVGGHSTAKSAAGILLSLSNSQM